MSDWKGNCDISADGHPVIRVQGETVPEWARKQAAINLKLDPEKLKQAIEMIGEDEVRRRYPEAFSDGEDESGDKQNA